MSRIVDCFDDACKKYGERTAFIDIKGREMKKISFNKLSADVDRACASLMAKGMKKGERVVLFVAPSYELLVFMIASLRLGISIMIIDIWAGKRLIRRTLEEYRADYIAVSGRTKLVRLVFGELRRIKDVILIEKLIAENGYEKVNKMQERPGNREVAGDEVAVLTMTTGSMGRPKIIIRSHDDLYRQLDLVRRNINARSEDTVVLNTSFMYHFVNILNGYTGIIMPTKKPKILRLFNRDNRLQKLPAQVVITTPDFCMETEILFQEVEEVYIGGAVLNLYEAELIRNKFQNAKITYIYGATECNLICKTDIDEYINNLKKGQTVLGETVSGVLIKTDENNEILVHSDVVLTAYLNPENKRGVVDEKLFYLGRKDVFVRGKKGDIFSNDLEQEAIRRFSGIRKAAVFYHEGKNFLFVEGSCEEEALRNHVKEWGIGEEVVITFLSKIPCDAKHHSKINYNKLKRMVEKSKDRNK